MLWLHNILYALCSIFSIVWYRCFDKLLMPECADYSYICIIIYFSVPLLSTFTPKLLKYKFFRNENNTELTIICDLVSAIAIFINIYMITQYIGSKFHTQETSVIVNMVSIVSVLLLVIYIFHTIIKKLVKITYSKLIMIASLIVLLGWLDSRERSLIVIFSIVLNTVVSMEDRMSLISFLKKKEIGNKFIWAQNNEDDLTDPERKGKFIAQKIIIYTIIAIIYIIMRMTENINLSLYIYSIIEHAELNSYPQIIKYLFKGMDRILVSEFVCLILCFDKNIMQILKKIFDVKIK